MNHRPDAIELLRIARHSLVESVLPHVPAELRYTTLMIANAMVISEREIAAGDAAAEAAIARIGALLGEPDRSPQPCDVRGTLAESNRRLAAAIREGRFDREQRPALLDHLLETAVAQLEVANPKVLAT